MVSDRGQALGTLGIPSVHTHKYPTAHTQSSMSSVVLSPAYFPTWKRVWQCICDHFCFHLGGGGGEERRPDSTSRPIGSVTKTVVQYDRLHKCMCTDQFFHSRTTILPPEKDLKDMVERFADFHCNFLRKYGRLTDLHA